MAKRFTDTEKWKKRFFKNTPIEYKMFWLYLLDDCDHAGIWQVDFEIAELRLGVKLSEKKARGFFAERVVVFDNETKWFIPDFIAFQYGELTEKNKMFKPVSSILNKHDLMGHLSPINGGKEQVQVKVMVKDKEEEELKRAGLVFNVEETVLENMIEFEAVCMKSKKTAEQGRVSLEKYHLFMQRENKYPVTRKQAFAGFNLWLLNEFKSPETKVYKQSTQQDNEW